MDRFGGSFAVLLISAFILQSAKAAEDVKEIACSFLLNWAINGVKSVTATANAKINVTWVSRFSVEAEPRINVSENANRHSRAAQWARFGRPKGGIYSPQRRRRRTVELLRRGRRRTNVEISSRA
jgi:hypothetical protein